ncbi:MAG: threonylcarbamoyl-AMP synthase [Candidatus Doudnabacteria bacterium]|nr:threonylcarbamoyl-AMP synthase [Candidatus Doudnabacteria bacterium]
MKSGGVVVYPTDTAYGMAVDATNTAAVEKLYRVKGRDFKKPVHVIPPSQQAIGQFAKVSQTAKKLMRVFMPGPITLVLPLKSAAKNWKKLSAGTKTIGVRIPDHTLALQLVKALGKPITTTSANVSSQPNCYSVPEVTKQFANQAYKPDFYLDGGKLRKLKPSTVVLLTEEHAKIIRPGPIKETEIKRALK